MNARALYHIARADFLERVRRYSFLVMLAFTLYTAYEANRGNIVLSLESYRGVYNSAWLGLLLSMTATFLVTMVGFYVIKNTVERDRHTGVGEILATTPLGRMTYLTGKALSNFAVLGVIMVILIGAALAMQLWRAEQSGIDAWKLLAPFLFFTLPAFAFLSALAVLFECVPGLRGGFGNVFYFFFWAMLLAAGIESKIMTLDLVGAGTIERSVKARAMADLPDYKGGFSFQIGPHSHQEFKTFVWDGIDWTAPLVLSRVAWFGFALLVLLLAAVFFDRFDPSRGLLQRAGAALGLGSRGQPRQQPEAAEAVEAGAGNGGALPPSIQHAAHLTPLARAAHARRFGAVLAAEVRLMLKGRSRWWYLVALGLLVGSFAAPAGDAGGKVLAFAWLWPVLLWSQMGTREGRFATGPLIFSSPRSLTSQLPAAWMAGVGVALLTGAGVGVRLVLARDWIHLLAWLVGALFVPALALALGVWSGTSKLFEGLYTAWWYAGPAQPTPALDFMGATPGLSVRIPLYYLVATILLLGVAAAGRWRQIRS
jgi:ABC-type transport system involved in multi-copper enzyme maturation permease subunit